MRVLMFGWEFPPMNKGGLGTACFGLTKSLSQQGVDVTFVVPRLEDDVESHVDLVPANIEKVKIRHVNSPIHAYMGEEAYDDEAIKFSSTGKGELYGRNLYQEVKRYAAVAETIAEKTEHDVIHAHDWHTFEAGIRARETSGKPLVVHVHATEFDRTGGNGVNQMVYELERKGMHAADKVITVSNYTKSKVMEHYGVPEAKIEVVHNGVDFTYDPPPAERTLGKTVLFLGRITLQKGPDWFVKSAKKVLEVEPDTTFVVAGAGDMERKMIEQAAAEGIGHRMLFTGFLRGDDIARAYRMADVYVMPSVSEPFGITPLESLRNNVPVIISKQSGVSEVLTHALKVDFWDIDRTANYIASVLRYRPLKETLAHYGSKEVDNLTWDTPAERCREIYSSVRGTSW